MQFYLLFFLFFCYPTSHSLQYIQKTKCTLFCKHNEHVQKQKISTNLSKPYALKKIPFCNIYGGQRDHYKDQFCFLPNCNIFQKISSFSNTSGKNTQSWVEITTSNYIAVFSFIQGELQYKVQDQKKLTKHGSDWLQLKHWGVAPLQFVEKKILSHCSVIPPIINSEAQLRHL